MTAPFAARIFSCRPSQIIFALTCLAAAFAAGGMSSARASEEHEVEISIKDHKFDPEALKFPAGKPIKITVKNLDPTPEEFESNDVGFEKIIAGNSSAIVRVKPLKPGTYIFFGEFNPGTALGHIVVE
jgi:plastocyanin